MTTTPLLTSFLILVMLLGAHLSCDSLLITVNPEFTFQLIQV